MDFEPKFGSPGDLVAVVVIIIIGAVIGLLMGLVGVYSWIKAGALEGQSTSTHAGL